MYSILLVLAFDQYGSSLQITTLVFTETVTDVFACFAWYSFGTIL